MLARVSPTASSFDAADETEPDGDFGHSVDDSQEEKNEQKDHGLGGHVPTVVVLEVLLWGISRVGGPWDPVYMVYITIPVYMVYITIPVYTVKPLMLASIIFSVLPYTTF